MTNQTTKVKAQDKTKMCEIDDQILKMFEIKKRLGKGAYGIVWKALDKRSNAIVAVKKIFDAFRDETDAQRTFREIIFLNAFRSHPNIVKLHGVFKASNNLDIYLVFEYMESDLHNIIKRGTVLKDIHKRYVMYQLINAIKYIHSGNVIHRDLKPSNILIDSKCRCKLADFGLARSVTNRDAANEDNLSVPLLTDYVATRWYRAPEILVASKRYTKGIDMWSLGCILGEMLRGKPLFQGTSTINQIERIVSALPEITERDIESVGADFGAVLLSKQISREQRITIEDVLGEVPNDALNLIKSLLVLDPLARLTAHQALDHPYVTRFRHSIVENDLRVDIVPPFSDDVRLTVTEYRAKLYEIVDGVPGPRVSNKATNLQIKQKSSTQKLKISGSRRDLKLSKDPQEIQSIAKTKPLMQTEIKTRCNQEQVPIKTNSPKIQTVPIRTMISSLSTKPVLSKSDILLQSKDIQETKILRNAGSRKKNKTKNIGNTTLKLENPHYIGNTNNQSCSQEMSPNNTSNYNSFNKSKIYANNTKHLKSQLQLQQQLQQEQQNEQINVNNMKNGLINNMTQQKYVNNIKDKLCSKKIHQKQYADEKISAAEATSTEYHNDDSPIKNQNRRINNSSGEMGASKISHIDMSNNLLLTRENFKKWIANNKNKSTSFNKTILERQSNSNVSQLLPYVATDLSNDECHCYEERLRRIEEEIQSYKQEVKTFAHDTLLFTQQRLKSADNKLFETTATMENIKLPKSTRTLAANYIDNTKICNANCNTNSIKKINITSDSMETTIKAGVTNLPPVNAKNSIYQLISSSQNRKHNNEIGSGGSGDHIVGANSQITKHFDFNCPDYSQEPLQMKRNISSVIKTHLQAPSQEIQQFSYAEAKPNGNKRKTTYVY